MQLVHQAIAQFILKYRNSISKEDHILLSLAKLFCNHFNIHCHLWLQHFHGISTKFINACIHLISSGIHDWADQPVRPVEIVCQSIHCRNGDQRFFQCQSQTLCCGRSNPQSGKGTRTCCDRNCVNGCQIQLCHIRDFIQHGKQGLRMCLFIIHGIFCQQITICAVTFHNRHTGYQS